MKKVKEAVYNSLTNDSTLTSLLGTGNRVFSFWPETLAIYPSITFFEVSTTREPARDLWRSTYQIDVWGKPQDDVDSIAERIVKLFDGQTLSVGTVDNCFGGKVETISEDSDGEVKRRIIDVTFFSLL